MPPAKTGEYPSDTVWHEIFAGSNFCDFCGFFHGPQKKRFLRKNLLDFWTNIPRAKLSENFSLLGTDNVRGQISEHIFAPNEGYCLHRIKYIY